MQSEVLKFRLLQSTQEGDLSGREIIWQTVLHLIKRSPILGVGNTGYAYFMQTNFGSVTSPHNVILEVLCLTGITGLFLYLIFLYRIFKISLNRYKMDGFLLPLMLIIPILGLLFSGQILAVKIGWVIFAYITGSLNTNPQ
jgi:O-antigen ligase